MIKNIYSLNSAEIYRQILKDLNEMPLKELMANPGYFALLEQIGVSMLKQGETIYPCFYAKDNGETGCTNGSDIWINTWSPMSLSVEKFSKKLEQQKKPKWFSQLPDTCSPQQMSYLVNVGLLCHEFGHVLYTNFKELSVQFDEIMKGEFKYCQEEQKLKKLLNSNFKDSLLNNIHFIENSVEDGYIENCLAIDYPSNGIVVRGLQNARNMLFFGSPSLLELEQLVFDGERDIPSVFCTWLLLTIRGFEPKDLDKCEGELHEILAEAIEKAKPLADDYIKSSKNHYKDLAALYDILASLYPEPKPNKKQSGDGQGESKEQSQDSQSQDSNNSNKGNGSNQKQSSSKGSNNSSSSQGEQKEEQGSDSENNQEQNDSNSSDDLKNNQSPTNSEATAKERSKMGMNQKELSNADKRQALRNPYRENEEEELAQKQKKADRAMNKAKSGKDSANDSFLRKLAKQLLEKEVGNKQKEELKETFDGISGYFEREGYEIANIQQIEANKGDELTYDHIYKLLEPTIKACVRKIRQILKKREYDDEDSGFNFGQRLVSREIYRQDKKCFSRELCPDNEPDVVFSIMVDQSGSMGGQKILSARNTAILFDAVARELNIPTRIIGHTTGRYEPNAVVYNYRNYESNDKEKYSLSNIKAYYGNVDTLVLTGLCDDLLKRKEESKVMIVISDGAPCGFNGTYTNGNYKGVPFKKLNCCCDDEMKELNACVRYYRKKGIKVIGVAIDEVATIKGIYEEGTLDCTDLKKLPISMLKLFKKYVLK